MKKEHTHMTVAQLYKRDETMWLLYTQGSWTMIELGNLYNITKQRVHEILVRCAKRKGEQIETYYKLGETQEHDNR